MSLPQEGLISKVKVLEIGNDYFLQKDCKT